MNANEFRQNTAYYFTGKSEGLFPYENKVGILKLNQNGQFFVEFEGQSNELLKIFYEDKSHKISPIPLSPEILEKCGFVYRNEHRGVGCIMDLGDTASVGILENGFRYLLLWKAPLKYLHQLQNIYFAHFGEELTYNQ